MSMLAPAMNPLESKLMRMNLPCHIMAQAHHITLRRKQFIEKSGSRIGFESFRIGSERRENGQYKRMQKLRQKLWRTKRDELSFFTVLALPNASRIGLACRS